MKKDNLDFTWVDLITEENRKTLEKMNEIEDMDVFDEFYEAFTTDADSEFEKIYWLYKSAGDHERDLIDALFVHLCGYSFQTLVAQHLKAEALT